MKTNLIAKLTMCILLAALAIPAAIFLAGLIGALKTATAL